MIARKNIRTSYLRHCLGLFSFFILAQVSVATCFAADPLPEKGVKPTMTAEEIDNLTQEISEITMSPFCPGRTLSSCPSPQARELKEQIEQWVARGYSKTAVRNQLLGMFGEGVRGTPRQEGFGLMAWIVPIIFVLLFLLLVGFTLRKLRSSSSTEEDHPEESGQAVGIEPEIEKRIEDELKRRQES